MPAISITDVSKRFGTVKALDRVSFDVPRGELFGLIGPDGAGKSTLYKLLTTLQLPDSGSLTVGGFEAVRDYRRIRSSIGYMPERFSLYPTLTVRENLEFFASLFGVSVKDNFDLISPIYNQQLAHFPNRKAGALSGGMKQKLALCCALIHRPEILLLDEPTTGVDAVSRSEFWQMLAQLRRQDITIMVSTGYMDEAMLCSRIALINNGRIMGVDSPQALVATLDERLYAASAADMFALLTALRALPDVEMCYTFGATIHLVAKPGFNPQAAAQALQSQGISGLTLKPVQGNIEDLFIKKLGKSV